METKSPKRKGTVNRAVFVAVWPNQPVKVCAKHAKEITNVGAAIGLQVPLLPYSGNDECINCKNEVGTKQIMIDQ